MMRKIVILLMSLSLCWTTLACSSPTATQTYQNPNNNRASAPAPTQLASGQYPVQQVTYDDINGEYTLMLLDTPPGTPAVYRSSDLQMARLTDEQMAAGQRNYLDINNNQAVLHLTEDYKIEYVHNVTETQPNPQTGQPETVIVRRETGFWAPFAGALAGQALGSLLFAPRYYVPPVFQPGVVLTGYGGHGNSYNQAVSSYRSRYQAPPPAVRNRQAFRTTGGLRRSPSLNQPTTTRRVPQSGTRATGSGYGSSRLRRSNQSRPSRADRPSFGSGSRSRRPAGAGFGSRGRRR